MSILTMNLFQQCLDSFQIDAFFHQKVDRIAKIHAKAVIIDTVGLIPIGSVALIGRILGGIIQTIGKCSKTIDHHFTNFAHHTSLVLVNRKCPTKVCAKEFHRLLRGGHHIEWREQFSVRSALYAIAFLSVPKVEVSLVVECQQGVDVGHVVLAGGHLEHSIVADILVAKVGEITIWLHLGTEDV